MRDALPTKEEIAPQAGFFKRSEILSTDGKGVSFTSSMTTDIDEFNYKAIIFLIVNNGISSIKPVFL